MRTLSNLIHLDSPRVRAPPGPAPVQPDWDDEPMDQGGVNVDRGPGLVNRMAAPQMPVVEVPVVDFPLNNEEEESDAATVVGTDNEEEAAE